MKTNLIVSLAAALIATVCCRGDVPITKSRPNVLFIAVDDLRDWVGYLGHHPHATTPNFDRLAARGMVFERAYCAAPSCCPIKPGRATWVERAP